MLFRSVVEAWFPGVHCDVGGGYAAPLDRARLAMTAARVHNAESKVVDYWDRGGHLPKDLSEANLDSSDSTDGWGLRLVYEIDADGAGFAVRALGVPARARAGTNDRSKLEVVRRVGEGR